MTRYIALLRGINVGAANRIRMDDLKRVFVNAGFMNVETYIQSGNVLFSSDAPEEGAREKIRLALENDAGIHTVVVLRTAEEMDKILRNSPYSANEIAAAQAANTEGESFHVCLLPFPPAAAALGSLASVPLEGDAFAVVGREVYLLLSRSIRVSKLAVRAQKVLAETTVRNWNTIVKLNDIAKEIEET
jgi:uncharacterized protein (DUF1697 family)